MTLKSIAISTASNSSNEDHEYAVTKDNILSHVDLNALRRALKNKEDGFVVIGHCHDKRKYTTYITMKHITSFTVIEEHD